MVAFGLPHGPPNAIRWGLAHTCREVHRSTCRPLSAPCEASIRRGSGPALGFVIAIGSTAFKPARGAA